VPALLQHEVLPARTGDAVATIGWTSATTLHATPDGPDLRDLAQAGDRYLGVLRLEGLHVGSDCTVRTGDRVLIRPDPQAAPGGNQPHLVVEGLFVARELEAQGEARVEVRGGRVELNNHLLAERLSSWHLEGVWSVRPEAPLPEAPLSVADLALVGATLDLRRTLAAETLRIQGGQLGVVDLHVQEPLALEGEGASVTATGTARCEADLRLDSGTSLQAAELDVAADLRMDDATLQTPALAVDGALVQQGGSVQVESLTAATASVGGQLSAESMELEGLLSVTAGGWILHPGPVSAGLRRLRIVAPVAEVLASGRIDVTGRGYAGGGDNNIVRPRRVWGSQSFDDERRGGNHAGLGGINGVGRVDDRRVYGDYRAPIWGGGGGASWDERGHQPANGGPGGGVVRMLVEGELAVDGAIIADGEAGAVIFPDAHEGGGGGGAGGSVWLQVGTLRGAGRIWARGGAGGAGAYAAGSGGGGGRVAVQADDISFPRERFSARGGAAVHQDAAHQGGAGTVFLQHPAAPLGELIVDNEGLPCQSTPWVDVGLGTAAEVYPDSVDVWNVDYPSAAGHPLLVGWPVRFGAGPDALVLTIADHDADSLTLAAEGLDLTTVVEHGAAVHGYVHLDSLTVAGRASLQIGDVLHLEAPPVIVEGGTLHADRLEAP